MNDLPQSSLNSLLESYVDDSKLLLSFTIQDVDSAIVPLGCYFWSNEMVLLARVQAQGKNSGPASKTRYFVKRPFS